jgi:hypothetical protein
MQKSLGDFALVTERLRGIRLHGQADGDDCLRYLLGHKSALGFLIWLDLSGSKVSDEGLRLLRPLKLLKRLNLAGTPVTGNGLRILKSLPQLGWLNLTDTAVGWWTRWRLRRMFPRLRVVTSAKG